MFILGHMEKTRLKYNKLKEVLAQKSKQNYELADHLGVSENTVSKWVTNTRQPDIETYHDIAKYLGVTIHDLLEATPPPIAKSAKKPRTENS